MEHPIPPGGAAPPAAAPAAGGSAPKSIDVERLPYSVRGLLTWLPEAEWHLIHAIVCHGIFIREIADVARFLDAVWTHSKRAEDRVSDRLTGVERDAFRDRVDAAVRQIVTVAVELARRAHLTEILQRNRSLVLRYVPEVKEKASAKPPRKTEPGVMEAQRPPIASSPRAQAALPSGPDLINRWLTGIRRIRESDPSFARAAEVISMYEKAIEGAGPRRAEVEHMLAQYKEATLHAKEGLEAVPAPLPESEAA